MAKFCFRTLIAALPVVILVTLLPDAAYAAAPCTATLARTPAARAALWQGALARFTAERPELTPEQTQVLAQATRLGDEIGTLREDEPAPAAFVRKATRFVEQARTLFSNDELGALFTSMGPTQIWLAQLTGTMPFCDCPPNPCPGGVCVMGCLTWDMPNGTRSVGLCVPAAPPEEPAQ